MDDSTSPSQKKVKIVEYNMEKIATSGHPAIQISTSFKSPITSPMLHPELWEIIFEKVVTDDYLRVINSCPEWNQLLNSRKTTELFSLALPFIMKFLPKNDFLTLRLVSQDWKRKSEIIYDNHPARLATTTSDPEFPMMSSRGRMLLSVDEGIKFESVESFQRFNSEMGNDYGNPFPGRCVWLRLRLKESEDSDSDDSDSEEDEEVRNPQIELDYWTAINQLLLQFGEHIWYLKLDYLFWSDHLVETRLRDMLLQVPNLKRLQLSFGDPKTDFYEESTEFNRRAVEFYEQNPPPKLENLEIFSCTSPKPAHPENFDDFINQLVKSYCPTDTLKRLNLPDTCYKPTPLPNLLELRTLICYLELPALKEASPKLENFVVIFQFERGVVYDSEYQDDRSSNSDDSDDDDNSVDNNIGVVFKGLQIFADTLKKLDLLPHPFTSNMKTRNFKVELPKLEKLCIAYSLPIDHLLQLKSLKYLEIHEPRIFRDKTYWSNIFEQLPKLRKVVHISGKKRRDFIRPL
ncbi:unnamed protein product [Orchesella dallaii]|uniref:F-box domain-containing protein n=1 Tax=Orchesella dallaii TaxID=48710 RepID=A0ABP1RV74_9HEXA